MDDNDEPEIISRESIQQQDDESTNIEDVLYVNISEEQFEKAEILKEQMRADFQNQKSL